MTDAPRQVADDVCALPLVRRLAALLDRDPAGFRTGDPLPEGWHQILFGPETMQSGLGADGHPRTGEFLPKLDGLPRRMLGGRRTRFGPPIRIGAVVRRVSEVAGTEEKRGRSGRLVIATVRHAITEDGAAEPAVIEEQQILYREAADAARASAPGPAPDARPLPAHSRLVTPDPVMLFRYSAVTFNGHRIHYDRPYATGEEGYPDLVVNGGLSALLLLELFRNAAGRAPREVSARNKRALFCGRPVRLCAAPAGETWTLWAEDDAGRTAVEATAS